MRMNIKHILVLAAGLAACGDDAVPADAPLLSPAPDASTDGPNTSGPDASTEAGTDGSTESPWVPPAPANLNFDGPVYDAVHVGDAWFVGGAFKRADLIAARGLIAVDMTGQPTGCSVEGGFDGRVYRIVHVGNALYVAGEFRSYREQSANRIAKLDATTCQLDTTFGPLNNNGFNGDVRALATNGSALYVGGDFTTYRGAPANNVAKLDLTTGALDTTFSPSGNNGFDASVQAIVVTATDVYVGGHFNSYRGAFQSAMGLAHLDATTGALVATFGAAGANTNGFESGVHALALSGNALYAGGGFTQYKGVLASANRIAKIDVTTGAIDTTFSPAGANANGFSNDVNTLELSGNALFVGGAFDNYRGVTGAAHRIAKLDATSGALDTTFSPPGSNGFAGNITSINVVGSSIIVGGSPLGGYRGSADLPGVAKVDIATGVLDPTFLEPSGHDYAGFGVNTGLSTVHVVGTTLWIGGNFRQLGGKSANGIARFSDADGAFDRTFSPAAANGFNDEVYALAASGTALYVGGDFTTYRGAAGSAYRLAKLDPKTGALDTTFSPSGAGANGFDDAIMTLIVDGNSLYVGGEFSRYRGVTSSALCIAKLDATSGAIDTTFSPPGNNGFDEGVAVLTKVGNSIYAGGWFENYRGTGSAKAIAKLDAASGALDTTFSPPGDNGFVGSVYAIAPLGSSLYVGGIFNAYRGVAEIANIAKLDATSGALDAQFTQAGPTSGFDDRVWAVAVSGGAVYAGGEFMSYRGVPSSASFLAKLDATSGALDTQFTPAGASGGGSQVNVVVPYESTLMLGGEFSRCEGGRCYENAHRVNRDTRLPQ